MTFAGIYTPLATPFDAAAEIDEAALRANTTRYLVTRLTGLIVLGSNGEAAQLDEDEADRAIAVVRDVVPRGRPLLAGTGRESTRATIAATRRAAALGVDAVMVRTPSFYKAQMTSDVFIRHYREVADASAVPVFLYNVMMYTGVNLMPDAVATLSEHPNIVGVKESGNDMVQLADTLARVREGFVVLAGSALTCYAALALGAHGAVLALGGVVPDLCVELIDRVRAGRHAEARELHRRLMPVARAIGPQHGVPGLKAALDLMGYRGGIPRPPLRPVLPEIVETIRAELIALGVFAAVRP
jgi:dihydrodipicolinate synthase/N-acetylneuraminate lyase